MSRLGGWFRSSGKPQSRSVSPSTADSIAKERESLADAMKWAELIMNDDIDGAGERLLQGDSAFHDMGSAVTFFMRSILGFEKEVMTETNNMLVECETRAWADLKHAQKRGPHSQGNKVYPPGTEYELVIAETQLMGAVVGVLHESLVEAMKSFYKLRKAFITLDAIIASESKFLGQQTPSRPTTPLSLTSLTPGIINGEKNADVEKRKEDSDSSDSELFVDAKETLSGMQTPLEIKVTTPGNETKMADLSISSSRAPSPLPPRSKHTDLSPEVEFEDSIDAFIHSGANMCFGILLLILSLVPPSFSRVLSIVGFRGDRARSVKMLWRSASHPNLNGAVSGMMLLVFYNGLLGAADILPHEKDYDDDAEAVGAPRNKCELLLAEMRSRYPDSRLWLVEEARMLATDRDLSKAIALLTEGKESKMKQVTALNNFELSINGMAAQNWVLMRDTFLGCLEVNDWSPSMYYYMAGCASLELYRDAFHNGDENEARRQKIKTEEFLRKAPTVTGKKRFMARQLPLETFLQLRVQKWEARAKELKIDLADAIGSSPALEMCYIWNAQKRMGIEELEKGLSNLKWERGTASKEPAEKIKADKSEMAVWAVSMASLLRGLGRLNEAKTVLEEHVLPHDK